MKAEASGAWFEIVVFHYAVALFAVAVAVAGAAVADAGAVLADDKVHVAGSVFVLDPYYPIPFAT